MSEKGVIMKSVRLSVKNLFLLNMFNSFSTPTFLNAAEESAGQIAGEHESRHKR